MHAALTFLNQTLLGLLRAPALFSTSSIVEFVIQKFLVFRLRSFVEAAGIALGYYTWPGRQADWTSISMWKPWTLNLLYNYIPEVTYQFYIK